MGVRWQTSVRHPLWLTGLLLVALISFGGCTREDKGDGQEPVSQSLVLKLEAPTGVRLGETVPLKLKVKNAGDRPAQLTLGGRPAYDFVVTGPEGTEVWRWSHGQFNQAILQLTTLKPAKELEFTGEWSQLDNDGNPVPPGSYRVRGILHMDPPQKLETDPKPLLISR